MACNSPEPLEQRFEDAWPTATWADSHVILAVSGGADSVAMLRAAISLKSAGGGRGQLHVAHFNHRLRGADADADQTFVERLCSQWDLPLKVGNANIAANLVAQGDGIEAIARNARYEFLRQAAERIGARYVAVAHTADDQVETVLHRILRGTGLEGLAGMRAARPLSPTISLARPLLGIRRWEVLAYLAALGQQFRTDATNEDRRFSRNRLRHELLPLLRDRFNTDVDKALLRLAEQAGEAQRPIAQLARNLADEVMTVESASALSASAANSLRIRIRILAEQPLLLIREVCKIGWSRSNWPQQAMGFEQWQQLAEMVRGESGCTTINLPCDVRARRLSDELLLEQRRPT